MDLPDLRDQRGHLVTRVQQVLWDFQDNVEFLARLVQREQEGTLVFQDLKDQMEKWETGEYRA